MAVIANRRSVMTLFSKPTCIHSHRTRLVLAEKNINIDIVSVDGPELPVRASYGSRRLAPLRFPPSFRGENPTRITS